MNSCFDPPYTPKSLGPRLAINICNDGITDWSPEYVFADAVKQSRPYTGTVDSNAWPTSDGSWEIFADAMSYIQGDYLLKFTGQATITGATIQNKQYDSGTNTTTATVASVGSSLNLTFSSTKRLAGDSPGTGFTNLQLMRPGYNFGDLWFSPFLSRLQAGNNMFKAIRFMGYNQGTSSSEANWSDRWAPSRSTYGLEGSPTTRGAPWEYVIDLCNRLNKHAWINIPYSATDDYVDKLAQAFRYGIDASGNPYTSDQANPVYPPLNPSLNLYLEWCNELWNFNTTRNYNDAVDEVNNHGDPNHLNYDSIGESWSWLWRRVAYKALWLGERFRAVFGDAAMGTRIRPVLAGQLANDDIVHEGLKYLKNVWGNGTPGAASFGHTSHAESYYIYAISGAVYNDPFNNTDPVTLDNCFAQMASYNTTLLGRINANHAHAVAHDVKLVAYEGGQGLWGATGGTVKTQAQSDARMGDIYNAILNNWFNNHAQAELFFHWNMVSRWNSYGYWGLSSDETTEATPKWSALKTYVKE